MPSGEVAFIEYVCALELIDPLVFFAVTTSVREAEMTAVQSTVLESVWVQKMVPPWAVTSLAFMPTESVTLIVVSVIDDVLDVVGAVI